MRHFLRPSLFIALLPLALLPLAFPAATAATKTDQALVAAAVESLHAALVQADVAALSALVAPGVSYGHSNGNVQDRAALLAAVKADELDLLKIETPEQSIAIEGSVAVVRHLFAADFRKAGAPGSLKVGSLQVWQKHQGQWKLLARQAYKL